MSVLQGQTFSPVLGGANTDPGLRLEAGWPTPSAGAEGSYTPLQQVGKGTCFLGLNHQRKGGCWRGSRQSHRYSMPG